MANEAKFTPGPWRATFGEVAAVLGSDSGRVAIATNLSLHARRDGNEVEANARLIAAAPTMRELLEQLAENIERLGHGSYSLESREGFDAQLFVDQLRGVLAVTGSPQ